MKPTSEMSMWREERVPLEPKVIKLPDFPEPLTLREQAAIAAMQATIRSVSGMNSIHDIISDGFTGEKKTYPNEIAQFAVACADALVNELNKKIEP